MTLLPNLSFDTAKDLTGVGLVNFSPMILVGRTTLPATSMAEMVAWAKKASST